MLIADANSRLAFLAPNPFCLLLIQTPIVPSPQSPSTAAASHLLHCTAVLPMVTMHHIFALFACHSCCNFLPIQALQPTLQEPQPYVQFRANKTLPLPLSVPQLLVRKATHQGIVTVPPKPQPFSNWKPPTHCHYPLPSLSHLSNWKLSKYCSHL